MSSLDPSTRDQREGILGPLFRLAQFVARATDTALERASRLLGSTGGLTTGWLLLLFALAAYSVFAPFDLSRLVTGDALYPVHMLHFPFLEFRPPPSNNLFPDVMVHWALNPFIPEALSQKLVAGWLLFAATVLIIGVFRGPLAALVIAALLFLTGFGAVDSTSHYTLPLTVLAFQLVRNRWVQGVILFASVFSDLLFLLPAALLILRRGEEDRLIERLAICFVAGVLNMLHSEFSQVLPGIALAVFLFWSAALVARVFALERVMALAVTALLVALTLSGVEAIRYAIPVAACFALLLFDDRVLTFDWRAPAGLLLSLGIFAVTVNPAHLDLLNRQYDCLLDFLSEAGINTIAADHWTAKPLYFAALEREQELIITQMNFVADTNDYWMAPYDNSGAPTRHAFRSNTVCADIWDAVSFPQQNCSQDAVAPIVERQAICNGLEVFSYDRPIPGTYVPRPESKLASIWTNVGEYFSR